MSNPKNNALTLDDANVDGDTITFDTLTPDDYGDGSAKITVANRASGTVPSQIATFDADGQALRDIRDWIDHCLAQSEDNE
jgi:hypothetical protein